MCLRVVTTPLPVRATAHVLEGVSLKWSIFIGIFENLEKMSPKSMKLQGNKLKIVYKSAKNAQNPQKWTISVIHFLLAGIRPAHNDMINPM